MKNKKWLKELLELQSVTGEEHIIFTYLKNLFESNRIEYTELPHGDLVVGQRHPEILFSAHVDEVGFTISKIHESGRCNIKGVGWVYPWLFSGRDVQVTTDDGSIHYGIVVYDKAFNQKITKWNHIKIDFGFDSKQDLLSKGITEGIFGTYKKSYWETDNRVFATSFDNRLSVWMFLALILKYKKLIEHGIIAFAFTSDEEVENDGAKKTIPWVDPKAVCVVDIMPHSLLESAHTLDMSAGPYILNKTLDYSLPNGWKQRLSNIPFVAINGKSEYLKDSEPKMFQKKGYMESINLTTIVENYHHGTYAVRRDAITKTEYALNQIIQGIKKH